MNRIESLRVPGWTSAFYFRGKNTPLQEIGRKLGVQYVLEASVQVEGEKLRVIPRLLSVADGYQIWSEKYDRNREDIFDVEDDIARMVVDSLKVRIVGLSGLSLTYSILGDDVYQPPHEVFPIARAYELKALEADDNLAEAHFASLAF